MQHMISISRRLDLSGHPWELLINGAPMSLFDSIPTQQQVDQEIQRFDRRKGWITSCTARILHVMQRTSSLNHVP